jgi:hypothetical protein
VDVALLWIFIPACASIFPRRFISSDKPRGKFTPRGCGIDWKFLNVRSWPIFGLTGKAYLYSITSSARVSNRGGIVSPSAWAVFKLMANFVGCWIGRSAGSAPRRIRAT